MHLISFCWRSAIAPLLLCFHVKAAFLVERREFDQFITQYGREYKQGSKEYADRRVVFERRLKEAQQQNARPSRRWTAGVNHMLDRTDAEFASRLGWRHFGGQTRLHGTTGNSPIGTSFLQVGSIKSSVDWRGLRMASSVVDQGDCGSCWAVASAAILEAAYEIKYNASRTFSLQELVSCVQNPRKCGGDGGCQGATVELAMDWVLHRGLATAESEEYQHRELSCSKPLFRSRLEDSGSLDSDGRLSEFPDISDRYATIAMSFERDRISGAHSAGLRSFVTLPKNRYEPLLRAVAESGPVAVSVAADNWLLYESGVFDACSSFTINHAVSLFGYGEESNGKYWLIRNSWGQGWGENGFIRLLRSDDEETKCGMDTSPREGMACDGAPEQVEVCGICGILYDSVVPHLASSIEFDSALVEAGAKAQSGISVVRSEPTKATDSEAYLQADGSVFASRELRRTRVVPF